MNLYLLTTALLFGSVLSRPSADRIAQFNTQIDTLLKKEDNACVKALNNYYTTVDAYPHNAMNEGAANDLDDIGQMGYCNSLPSAEYAVSSFNVTSLPILVRFGMCLPKECAQADYNKAGVAITNVVDPIFIGVLNSACPGCFPDFEAFQFFYRKTNEYVATWQGSEETGMIITVSVGVGLIIVLIGISCISHYVLKRRS
jgi:hypothetical protein